MLALGSTGDILPYIDLEAASELDYLTPERLVDVIQQGVYNENIRHRAADIGRSIQKEQGISEAVQIITGL